MCRLLIYNRIVTAYYKRLCVDHTSLDTHRPGSNRSTVYSNDNQLTAYVISTLGTYNCHTIADKMKQDCRAFNDHRRHYSTANFTFYGVVDPSRPIYPADIRERWVEDG